MKQYTLSSARRMRKLLRELQSEEFILMNKGPNTTELQDKITNFCVEFAIIKDEVSQAHKSTHNRVEEILSCLTGGMRNTLIRGGISNDEAL